MIYVGSARIGENGKATGGKAGDQKQTTINDMTGEVSIQKFYVASKGWYILRPIKTSDAELLASAMLKACNNNNIGYNQNNRLGVIKNGITTALKTDADCSSLVRACIIYAMHKDVGNFTTANERAVLKNSGLFRDVGKYKDSVSTPVFDGDVLVTCSKGHTVIVVSGNSRPEEVAEMTEYTVTASYLNVRTLPDASSSIIKVLSHGQRVKSSKNVGKWVYVDALKGYCSSKYLK